MRRQNVDAVAARFEDARDLRMHLSEIRHMLKDIRRKNDIDAGVGKGDVAAIVIQNWKFAIRRVIGIRHFDGGDVEPAPFELYRLLTGARAYLKNTRAWRKKSDDPVNFGISDCVEERN